MRSMWDCHFRSLSIITPRYLHRSTLVRTVSFNFQLLEYRETTDRHTDRQHLMTIAELAMQLQRSAKNVKVRQTILYPFRVLYGYPCFRHCLLGVACCFHGNGRIWTFREFEVVMRAQKRPETICNRITESQSNICISNWGTHEDERTVLYKTKSLYGTKPNTNRKTNHNPNTNPIQLFYAFFEHRPLIFSLARSGDGARKKHKTTEQGWYLGQFRVRVSIRLNAIQIKHRPRVS